MRKRLALLVGQPDESLQNIFLKGFVGRAKEKDYDTCIFAMHARYQTSAGREKGDSAIYSLVNYRDYDAVVVMADNIRTPGVRSQIEEELHETYEGPVLFVEAESKYFPSVMSDNFSTSKKIVEHLITEHGFKDIAYLAGQEHHPHSKARLEGFKAAMAEHGLEINKDRIFYGDFWINSGQATAIKLLEDRDNMPEAIACGSDYMAMGLIEELEQADVLVPEDIAVVAFDAREEARDFFIPVTTIQLPVKEMGKYCVDYVEALFNGESVPEFTPEPEIFIGQSCGCTENKRSHEWKDEYDKETLSLEFESKISEMQDDLFNQTEASGIINTIFSYVQNIRPFDSFYLCLNEAWSKDSFDSDYGKSYSDKMLEAISCGEDFRDSSSSTDLFDRKMIIPALEEESYKARSFIFSPVYYEGTCHGYAVINLGGYGWCYHEMYLRWLSAVARGLEGYRRTSVMQDNMKKLEQHLVRDEVTGLYNYKGYVANTVTQLEEFTNRTAHINLAVLDLHGLSDNFVNQKDRNSDKVLGDFAQIIMSQYSGGMSYLGGSEFLLSESFDD
ncbi:MAG: substrate-binding domain-containing protein, partial [Parasporobacterium sp.]|nr:substrate-binding domain-containing protein [Parasporobacterium sp.]